MRSRRSSRHAFVTPLLVLGYLLAAFPVRAEVLPALEIAIQFQGSCAVDGSITVVNETTGSQVLDERVSWSAARPIEIHGFGGASEPGEVLRLTLLDSDDVTILFTTTEFQYDAGSRFRAALSCASTPYRELVPDTAAASPHDTVLGLLLVVAGVLWFSIAGALTMQPRQTTPN